MVKTGGKKPRFRMFTWLSPAESTQGQGGEGPDTSPGALLTTLRQDSWAVGLFALTLVAVPLLATFAATNPDSPALLWLSAIPLLAATAAARAGYSRLLQQAERQFWNEVTAALGLRLVAVLVDATIATAWQSPSRFAYLAADIFYVLSFLALVIAVEKPMRRRVGLHASNLGKTRTWPGGSIFAFGLVVYFCLIPAILHPALYVTRLSSYYMFLIFALYIGARLALFAETTQSTRWRMHYSVLMVGTFLLFFSDLAACLRIAGLAADNTTTNSVLAGFSTMLGLLALAILVTATRLRHHPFPSEEPLFDSVNRKERLSWPHGNIVLFAILFPLIHLLFYSVGLLDALSRPVRDGFVLVWLLLLGSLALIQQRTLMNRARSQWVERMRAEEALHKSEETLRLINERTQAEEALRQSEEKFMKAFRAIPDSMVISTLSEGRIREVNDSFQNYFGYQREEVLGKTGLELDLWVELEDRAMMTSILQQRGMVRNFEFEFYSKAGERRVALLSGEIIDIDGETCLLMVLRDITQRSVEEKHVRDTASLLDHVDAAVLACDANGKLTYWNKSAERLYGWPAREVLGKSVDDQLALPSHVREEVEERGAWFGELRQLRRNGTEVVVRSQWLTVRSSSYKDGGQQIHLAINTPAMGSALDSEPTGDSF